MSTFKMGQLKATEVRYFVGKVGYNESKRMHNRVLLNSILVRLFQDLGKAPKDKSFFHHTVFSHKFDVLEQKLRKIKEEGLAPPMLFWLSEDGEE